VNHRSLHYLIATVFVLLPISGVVNSHAQKQPPSLGQDSHIKDPMGVGWTWGPVQQGVHVALSLNKLTYAVGEDITLHIAVQAVSSDHSVYGEPDAPRGAFFGDFSAAFHLTIIGEDGVIVGNEESSNLQYGLPFGSSGPIVCPPALKPGKVYPLDRSVKRLRSLPEQPGAYRLIVTWSPYPVSDPPCSETGRSSVKTFRPLVTVISLPVTIQIAGKAIAEPGIPDIPIYEGWREHFRAVDTPLGEATATEDLQTHIQWLRLTRTKEQTIGSLREQMQPGRRLAGWRFATQSDVLTFFSNFTGSADGRSSDPGIERALQHLLGGPLDTPRNPDTGWSRRDTLATIVELPPATSQEASSASGTPPCAGCSGVAVTSSAYMREDTINGQIDATVNPAYTPPRDWPWAADERVSPAANLAILVVRDAP